MSKNTNGMSGIQNLQALNSLAIGVGGGIDDDSLDAAYGRNVMEFIFYRCCICWKCYGNCLL